MSSLMTDSSLDKAALAVTKLKGAEDFRMWSAIMCIALDHTWGYVEGPDAIEPSERILTSMGATLDPSKLDPNNLDHYKDNPDYEAWVIGTRNACHRILLAVSDEVKGELLPYLESPAVEIMTHLRHLFEASGASAEFYALEKYHNAKISDYSSIGEFVTALQILAYDANRESRNPYGRIEPRNIAMRIIHSLPPPMRTLQTILLEQAPNSSTPSWDLLKLKQQIVADESCARLAGENLGTKKPGSGEPQALAVRAGGPRARKDPNDPIWLAQQTCYACGVIGHLRVNCMASPSLHEAHRAKRASEKAAFQPAANAATGSDSLAMVAEPHSGDAPEVCAAQSDSPPK